jgi:hypothetical protein
VEVLQYGMEKNENGRSKKIDYDTRSGDVTFLDRAVWHQGK